MLRFRLLALGSLLVLTASPGVVAGQATPVARPTAARTPALLVAATHAPLRVTGSDGRVHLEYDLVLSDVFTAPVRLVSLEVMTLEEHSLLRLAGDALEVMTQPLFGRAPTAQVPESGAVATMLDVAVPLDRVPERLTHRIAYDLPPDAPELAIVGSRELLGPELGVDPFAPVVIAPPLRGAGWLNGNGCCAASAQRSFRIAVDGARLVTPETFAVDWVRLDGTRLFAGDGTRNEQYVGFGAEMLAVADGTVSFVRDGVPEAVRNAPPAAVAFPIDDGGNQVVVALGPGGFAFYAHLQPGSVPVRVGDRVTTGQVLGRLGNTGNSTAPHLHFELIDGRDALTAASLPFVVDRWTLAGAIGPESTATDLRVAGPSRPQRHTLPLDGTVADFP